MIALLPQPSGPAATISAADAAGRSWQAVVVGAGPAGAAVAWRLAAAGVRVLLLDRHRLPRGKVCGCCLSVRALRELRALAADAVPAAAIPLDAVRLAHAGREVCVPLPEGRVVSREALDAHLVRHAIAAGCHWLPETTTSAIDETATDRKATVAVRATTAGVAGPAAVAIPAELVVLATGLADHVRITAATGVGPGHGVAPGSRIGVGGVLAATASALPAGELVMAVGAAGYCGLVRLEDGRIDVAAALDRVALVTAADPAEAVARLLDAAAGRGDWLPAAAAIRGTCFRATPPLTRSPPLVAGASRRILRVGDAAGYVEPFTGEGMGWALSSARVLVEAVVAPHGLRPAAVAADRYVAGHRREFLGLHARCRLVAGGLRHPAVVAAAVAAARALPWAARRIAPTLVGATWSGDEP